MTQQNFNALLSTINDIPRVFRDGSVCSTSANLVQVRGLCSFGQVGDLVILHPQNAPSVFGEILALRETVVDILPETGSTGIALDDRVSHLGPKRIMPDNSWLGRIIDPLLRPLDGRPLIKGPKEVSLKASPPAPSTRKRFGERLNSGLAAFDTFLPIVKGQRLGIFAGSGVGKSTLLADLAKEMQADVVVITLIGERGRELKDFVEDTLGPEGLKRAVIIAATSDQSAMLRRRSAWVGMAIAEYFRDQGAHVLLLADSVTRFAEAHREIALSTGESASLDGFPPSTTQELMALSERAGPGAIKAGDITAIFSVLVQGSDMEGTIADIMRGVLDGHVVLSREIAERGRFPAIDISKSVSRSLPNAATTEENETLSQARRLIGTYEEARILIKSGLYEAGSDDATDQAIKFRPIIEAFLSSTRLTTARKAFCLLETCLKQCRE
ncbi:flagellum-specific ATP synthase [Litoreibacter ascidiaceicola]|uniref:Flagellum-specific ATP synthase n=1 Tax=Litoreibacter ascidiaceicola TaxID=1486859 RepID=A0A1M5AS31_9RHOB|nr:FliI/YscN family ATPase [Litoreibacter ascidiaceicola]SHF33050.1 flagellum-specific ATP synthase [Litoreibacter ascidiaceicola]